MPSIIRAAREAEPAGIAHPTPPGAVNEAREHVGSATAHDEDLRARYIKNKLVLHICNFLDDINLTDDEWPVWIRIVNEISKISTFVSGEPTHVHCHNTTAAHHEEAPQPPGELHKLSGSLGDFRAITHRPAVSPLLYDLGYPFTTPTPPMPPPSPASSRSPTPDPPSSMSTGTVLPYRSVPFRVMRDNKPEVSEDGAFTLRVTRSRSSENLWPCGVKLETSTEPSTLHHPVKNTMETKELDGNTVNSFEYVLVKPQLAVNSDNDQSLVNQGKELLAAPIGIDRYRPHQPREAGLQSAMRADGRFRRATWAFRNATPDVLAFLRGSERASAVLDPTSKAA